MPDRETAAASHFFTQSDTVRQIIKKMNDKRERAHDLSGVHYPPDQECRMAAWALEGLLAERDALQDRAERAESENKALREALKDALDEILTLYAWSDQVGLYDIEEQPSVVRARAALNRENNDG